MASQRRRKTEPQKRGRSRTDKFTGHYAVESSDSFYQDVKRRRAEFEQLPPAKQQEAIERVRRVLNEEKAEQRRKPSPLALMAWRVYGVWVDWLPANLQEDAALHPN